MKRFSLFGKKRARFTFEYTPGLTDYRVFPDQPQPVKSLYRICKISMAVCIPLFSVISFFSLLVSLAGLLMVFLATFNTIRQKHGPKAAWVPVICSITGIFFGSVFARYVLTEVL
jgi:hypothetical protein